MAGEPIKLELNGWHREKLLPRNGVKDGSPAAICLLFKTRQNLSRSALPDPTEAARQAFRKSSETSFSRTKRIDDPHAGDAQSQHGKTHCHSMIVVRFDGCAVKRPRFNAQGLTIFRNSRAAFL